MNPSAESRPNAVPDREEILEQSRLLERYWERLRLFFLRRLSDVDAAEDAAQETIVRVTSALSQGKVRNTNALPGYVFQTAKYVSAHWHRKNERRARAMEGVRTETAARGFEPDPLSILVNQERRALVENALKALQDDDRAVLRALFYDGITTAQLATELGITPTAVRVRKHRALARLKQMCDPEAHAGPETISADG